MIDIILDTLQRGDPEEIDHLQSHTSHLFPGDIQTVTPEQMTSSICIPSCGCHEILQETPSNVVTFS